MSLRGAAFPRQRNEAYYTPGQHVWSLLDLLPMGLMREHVAWEPAAGAGTIAAELRHVFRIVIESDINAAASTVTAWDFLNSALPPAIEACGRSPLAIITNPPYGQGNALAVAFVARALAITEQSGGLVAMLLPFEFDPRLSRRDLVGGHRAFAAKITVAERIRWLNLPQSKSPPMGAHAWFVWSHDAEIRDRLGCCKLWVA